MRAVLGIDPGRADGGAAVLVASVRGRPRAVLGIVWRESGGRFRVQVQHDGRSADHGSASGIVALGGVIGTQARAVQDRLDTFVSVLSEGPYLGKNVQSALSVARTGAALESVAAYLLAAPESRTIVPGGWRKVLGVGAADREIAKARSLAEIPPMLPGLPDLVEGLGRVDHLTDAGGVALTGFLTECWSGTAAEWAARVGGATEQIPRVRAGRPGRA